MRDDVDTLTDERRDPVRPLVMLDQEAFIKHTVLLEDIGNTLDECLLRLNGPENGFMRGEIRDRLQRLRSRKWRA